MNYYIKVKNNTEEIHSKVYTKFKSVGIPGTIIRLIKFHEKTRTYFFDKGRFMSYSTNTFEYIITKFGLNEEDYKEIFLTNYKKLYTKVLN